MQHPYIWTTIGMSGCKQVSSQFRTLSHEHHNRFTGTVPSEIAELSSLTSLDLSGNKGLVGTVPTDVCDWVQMRHIRPMYEDDLAIIIECESDLICPIDCCLCRG